MLNKKSPLRAAIALMVILMCNISACSGANIVIFQVLCTYSHRIAMWPLIEDLINAGHNVTGISPFKMKSSHPKFNDYVPKVFPDLKSSMMIGTSWK